MKRTINISVLILVLAGLWFLGDWSQQTQVNEGATTMEGFIVFQNDAVYLVEDTDFNKDDAENLSIQEIISKYKFVAKLNISNSSSLKDIHNGDKVKIWYLEILESVPAKIKVLKIEKI
ncbi:MULTISPECIES: DUF3221 domain-containing protein [Parageobacillus]|uniref:DUF3221 domain-containing protein n=1 Tax=Parageobacillus galactosidasius TaxID=883812 RepID=A0A226QMY0_9BACL|nr:MULTISPECIES: DUF3221 domain-containing protein [Parageobacillus]MED4987999.1 DUF3221 domain-containing protein [Parageobacillus toebii]OXB92802.1 hypothetical protein B9L23_16795 [Parageobacillus galactosidasius]